MTCEHGDCRCAEIRVERAGKRYCSEDCADKENLRSPESRETSCHCGHPDCAAA